MPNEVTEICYDPVLGRTEWLRARVQETRGAGNEYRLIALVAMVACIGIFITVFGQAMLRIIGGQIATSADYFLITGMNQMMAVLAGAALIMAVPLTFIFLATRPTHLLLTDKAFQILWRIGFFVFCRVQFNWSDIDSIECKQGVGTESDLLLMNFRRYPGQFRLRVANLSQDDRQHLLEAFKSNALHAVEDPIVLRALTCTRDQTYTELWLQAFNSPPKHESMLPLQIGKHLHEGKYKIEGQLGAGGMGTAYLASNQQGSKVVLKEFILPVFVDTAICREALKAFENEARILKAIDHPNIVKLYDYFVSDQRAYMVLEYIDGPSLRSLIKQEATSGLPEKKSIEYALQILSALTHLHSQSPPVVHRDVTPENLVMNSKGQIKLIDFNVAQQTASSATSIFVGKPGFLPPEQFRGQPTTQSDIFAAGATLHYLLTGDEPVALLPSHPKSKRSSISLEMDNLIARMTAMDATARPASAEDVAVELRRLADT